MQVLVLPTALGINWGHLRIPKDERRLHFSIIVTYLVNEKQLANLEL